MPTGKEVAAITSRRTKSKSPPTLNSIKVSAPLSCAASAFLTSKSISLISVDVPILAFTLLVRPSPTPTGIEPCLRPPIMTIVPFATRLRIISGSIFSFLDISRISSLMSPSLANSSCVLIFISIFSRVHSAEEHNAKKYKKPQAFLT